MIATEIMQSHHLKADLLDSQRNQLLETVAQASSPNSAWKYKRNCSFKDLFCVDTQSAWRVAADGPSFGPGIMVRPLPHLSLFIWWISYQLPRWILLTWLRKWPCNARTPCNLTILLFLYFVVTWLTIPMIRLPIRAPRLQLSFPVTVWYCVDSGVSSRVDSNGT